MEAIKSIVKRNSLKSVEVCGFQAPDSFYEEAAIVCSTSVSEGWGMTLIEGASYGCVPVAFDNGGSVRDVITHGKNGFIVPAYKQDEYVRTLESLMHNSDLRNKIALSAQEDVRRFAPEIIAQQWLAAFYKFFV